MRDMLDLLAAHRVEFLVVGAFALAAHGIPRATGDIDIWVRADVPNARRLMAALVEFGAPVSTHAVTWKDFASPNTVYQLGVPPNRIDIMTTVDGVSFEDAYPRRIAASLFGRSVSIIGRDDLMANKRASARPKDLLDLALLGDPS